MVELEAQANNLAKFAQDAKMVFAVVTAAITNINTNTPGALVQAGVIGAKGAIITAASVIPRGTVSASSALLYGSTDNGATKFPLDSALIAAYANSTIIKRPRTAFDITEDSPIRVPAGMIVYAGSEVAAADGLVFAIQWTDF